MTDKMYERGKKKILTKLNIEEISGVDVPAQGPATVKLIKHEGEKPEMSTELKQQIAELQKKLADQEAGQKEAIAKAVAESLAKMTEADKMEAEKAKKMEEEKAKKEKEEMKKKEVEDAEKALAKAKGEDHQPVLYKSISGIEYRDAAQAELAKQNDSLTQRLAKIEDENKRVELEKRATTMFKNLKGSNDVKVALVKAIDTIDNVDVRKGVEELLKSADNTMSDLFKSRGTTAAADSSNEGHDALLKMAAEYQTKNPELSKEQAYNVVSQTEEGKQHLSKALKQSKGV